MYDINFGLAFASNLCFVMANALMVHFARWVTFLGGNELDIGWIMGVGAVGAVVGRPLMGRLIDRLGARAIWAAGNVVFAVTSLAYLGVDQIGPLIYLLRGCQMLAPAMIFTSTLAYLAHTTAPNRLAEGIGSFGASGFLGMAMGPWLGDLLLAAPGTERTETEFQILFCVTAGLMLAGLVLIPVLRADPPHPEGRSAGYFASLKRYWPGALLWICFTFGLCIAITFTFLTRYADVMHFERVGVLYFTTYGLVAFVSRVVLRRLPERLGNPQQVALGLLTMAIGLSSFWLVNHPALLILPAAWCGLAHGIVFHPMIAMVVSRFPASLRGTGSATALLALDAGLVIGSPFLGTIAYYLGYPAMFTVVAVACVLAIGAIPWKQRHSLEAEPPPGI